MRSGPFQKYQPHRKCPQTMGASGMMSMHVRAATSNRSYLYVVLIQGFVQVVDVEH
jgi:hypothetical protein